MVKELNFEVNQKENIKKVLKGIIKAYAFGIEKNQGYFMRKSYSL